MLERSVRTQRDRDNKLRKIFGGKPLANAGFTSVYAIGPENGRPLKIGLANNIANRVSGIQVSTWIPLKCHVIAWTKGPLLARQLETKCHEVLDKASKRISGEWFDITPDWAAKVMAHAAGEIGISILSHAEMLKKCQILREKQKHWDFFWDRPAQ